MSNARGSSDKAQALKRARRANRSAREAEKKARDAINANYLHEVVWAHPVVSGFLQNAGIVFRQGEAAEGQDPARAPILAVLSDDYGLPAIPVPKRERLVALLEKACGWVIGKRAKASALAAEIEVLLTAGPAERVSNPVGELAPATAPATATAIEEPSA